MKHLFFLPLLAAIMMSCSHKVSNSLEGKTMCIIGDSYVRNHRKPVEEAWHYKVAKKNGMTYHNYGINGACIAFDRRNRNFGRELSVRYKDMIDAADYVIVLAGHNDAGFISQSEDSLAKFKDNLEILCMGLRQKYPKAKIAFITPWNVNSPGFSTVIQLEQEACKRHKFGFLNAATTSGIDPNSADFRRRYFQGPNDTAHLNDEGHNLLIEWGEKFLKSLK